MQGSEFAELAAFIAIADHGSFVKAAGILGISTSTLSKTIRTLEERLGVRLFNRTTRSVALTEAGEHLKAKVRPALSQLGDAVESVNAFRDAPAGLLRLNVSNLAATMVIAPILAGFATAFPEIKLEISVEGGSVDIVEGGFDAGIRRDRRIEQDMIAVRITRESRFVAVASPEYLAKHPRPQTPQELRAHNCIRFRMPDGAISPWEFERNGKKLTPLIDGSLVVNNIDLLLRSALDGVGIGFLLETYVAAVIREGRLTPILEEWSPRFSGWHIYYPSRRQMRTPLKAFIEFVRNTPLLS
jgi:DNA-binding transcriptional LysR family regulator